MELKRKDLCMVREDDLNSLMIFIEFGITVEYLYFKNPYQSALQLLAHFLHRTNTVHSKLLAALVKISNYHITHCRPTSASQTREKESSTATFIVMIIDLEELGTPYKGEILVLPMQERGMLQCGMCYQDVLRGSVRVGG